MYKEFPTGNWNGDSSMKFKVEILDCTKPYKISYHVRYNINYPYSNLYINFQIYGKDKVTLIKDLNEMQLMDAKTGEPTGKGLGEIYDKTFEFLPSYYFPKNGFYTIDLKQYMRVNKLENIIAVGIKVENANTN